MEGFKKMITRTLNCIQKFMRSKSGQEMVALPGPIRAFFTPAEPSPVGFQGQLMHCKCIAIFQTENE